MVIHQDISFGKILVSWGKGKMRPALPVKNVTGGLEGMGGLSRARTGSRAEPKTPRR